MAEYMKWIKGSLAFTSGTLATKDIQMPVQRGQGRGMNLAVVIHKTEYSINAAWFTGFETDGENMVIALTKSTPTATPTLETADLLDWLMILYNETTGAGYDKTIHPVIHNFSPPLLVPNEKLVLSAATGSGTNGTVYYRIGYTIRSISQDEMYAALNNQ